MLAKNLIFLVEGRCGGNRAWSARSGYFDIACGFGAQPYGFVCGRRALCRCAPALGGAAGSVTRMDTILVVNAGSSSFKIPGLWD